MNELIHTGLKDKTGRAMYVGDIVQSRLGKFGKAGGPRTLRVIQFGKKYHLVDASSQDEKYGGTVLTQDMCDHLVVIDSQKIRG